MGQPRKGERPGNLKLIPQDVLKKFFGLILYVLITILVISLYGGNYAFLERVAVQMQDGMFKLRGKTDAPPADIIIVGIDDLSVDHIGKWPWKRDLLAGLVFAISRGSPEIVGLDIFLSEALEEDTSGRTDILAHQIYAAGNVILPIYFNYSDVGIIPAPAPDPILQSALGDKDSENVASSITRARQIYYPSAALVEASRGFGHINIDYDADGLIRTEPLLINYDEHLYPSFGLQLANAYLKVKPGKTRAAGQQGLYVGKIKIPTNKRQHMLLNYRGPNLTFRRVSAMEVLAGELDPEIFRGKIVLVGLTSTKSKTWVDVPAFGEMNEVERIATVTENVIHCDFLKGLAPLWSILALIVIGIFCALVLPNVSLIYRMVILLVLLFVTFNLCYILFSSFGILSKPVYPLLELLLFLIAAPGIKPRGPEKKESKQKGLGMEGAEAKAHAGVSVGEAEGKPSGVEKAPCKKVQTKGAVLEDTEQIDVGTPGFRGNHEGDMQEPESPSDSETPSSSDGTVELSNSWTFSDESSIPGRSAGTRSFTHLGRYKIIRALGRGGMGMVYKGVDPMLDRPVALKTIPLDFALSAAEIRQLKERLIQEAKAAGKLSHPNIVTVYDVGEQEGLHYIAMEYLSGYTLEEFIKKKGQLNYRIAAKIIMRTCEALGYAHSHGIVHRDIKPSNIMLLEDFHVKVMDFGIARLDATSLTQSHVALGTPHYISPEQLEGKTADRRSDIFSLGVVIYELLTKQKPFQGENISTLMYRILNYDPPPPSTLDHKIPPVFDQIVAKAMEKKPEERFQDTEEITKVLVEFISSFVVTRSIRM